MADVKLTDKPIAVLASGASLVVTQPVAGIESIRRVSAADALGYVTPEMYGAVGDGVHDDGPALKAALETEKPVLLTQDLYVLTPVIIQEKDVRLFGNNYTIHADMGNVMTDGSGNNLIYTFRFFCSYKLAPTGDEPYRKVYDIYDWTTEEIRGIPVTREDVGYVSTYKMGYMSYKGTVPLPDKYIAMMDPERIVTRYYDEHSLIIEDVNFSFVRCRGREGLEVDCYCNSKISNVSVISEDEEGTIGLRAICCFNLTLERIRSANWFANYVWMSGDGIDPVYARGNTGYGIQIAGGDRISILDCIAWNCKTGITLSGNRSIWTTNLILNGFHGGADNVNDNTNIRTSLDGQYTTYKYAGTITTHADLWNAVLSNITCAYPNCEKWSMKPFVASCPEISISNMSVESPIGHIEQGELSEILFLENVIAPNISLTLANSAASGYYGEQFIVRKVIARGCHFADVYNGACIAHLDMSDCVIEKRVFDINYLTMTNCTIYGRWPEEWSKLIPVSLLDKAVLTGCTIYANRSLGIGKRQPVIKAPDNAVYAVNCHIFKPSWGVTFRTEQTHICNLWEDNLHGLLFGDPEFGCFDTAELV